MTTPMCIVLIVFTYLWIGFCIAGCLASKYNLRSITDIDVFLMVITASWPIGLTATICRFLKAKFQRRSHGNT